MQFDRKMLDRLCRMNDEQLGEMIRRIAEEAGIDPRSLGIDTSSIQSIRNALQSTSEEDMERLGEVYDAYRQHRRER